MVYGTQLSLHLEQQTECRHLSSLYYSHRTLCLYSDVWGSEERAPRILNLGTRRWVFSFTPRPCYHRGKTSPCPLSGRLGELQSRSGGFERGKICSVYCKSNTFPRSSIPQYTLYPYVKWNTHSRLLCPLIARLCGNITQNYDFTREPG